MKFIFTINIITIFPLRFAYIFKKFRYFSKQFQINSVRILKVNILISFTFIISCCLSLTGFLSDFSSPAAA